MQYDANSSDNSFYVHVLKIIKWVVIIIIIISSSKFSIFTRLFFRAYIGEGKVRLVLFVTIAYYRCLH